MSSALTASPDILPEDDDDDDDCGDDDGGSVRVPAPKRRSLPAKTRRAASPARTASRVGSSAPAAAATSIHPRNGHKSPEANTRENRQVFEHVRYAAMVATSCLATAQHTAAGSGPAPAPAAAPAVSALPRYGAAAVLTPPVLLTNSVPAVTMSAALQPAPAPAVPLGTPFPPTAPAASDPFVATLPKFFNGNSNGNGNGNASSHSSSHSSTESSPSCTPQQAQSVAPAPLPLPALRSTDSPQVLPSPPLTVSSPPAPFSIQQPRLSIHDLLSLTAVEAARSPIACKTAPADKD